MPAEAQVVDADQVMPAADECITQMAADESGPARHENFHG